MNARTGTAYVANFGSDTVTPITIATNWPGPAIPAGYPPDSTPLAAATGRRGPAVSVGLYSYPTAMTFTGSTAVVLDTYGGQI